jgi:two-component system chemotaxis response regulator CheB
MKKINVLIVDDSAFMRKIITDIIQLDKDLEVIGIARNGKEAIQKIKDLSPDVVTMDVEMPIMDGITALKIIMEERPIPVVMCSTLTKEGAEATLEALELGTVDFISKPTQLFKMNMENVQKQINEKIKIAAKVRIIKRKTAQPFRTQNISRNIMGQSNIQKMKSIVAIGTSTGGPRALQDVIPYLKKDISASILIVQHMPAGFTKSLADRLNNLSEIHVKEAEDGDVLKQGCAYIAPGDYHLKLQKRSDLYQIKLTKEDPILGHRPSVDAMMHSLVQLKPSKLMGVIMTGMGSDGASGMQNIKLQGGYTIAQDEKTCVVFGMPKSAIKLGCIDEIVPLQSIASTIMRIVGV